MKFDVTNKRIYCNGVVTRHLSETHYSERELLKFLSDALRQKELIEEGITNLRGILAGEPVDHEPNPYGKPLNERLKNGRINL